MKLIELQQQASNGDYFKAWTDKGTEYLCRWIDVKRGLFQLGEKRCECNVDGALNAKVELESPYQ